MPKISWLLEWLWRLGACCLTWAGVPALRFLWSGIPVYYRHYVRLIRQSFSRCSSIPRDQKCLLLQQVTDSSHVDGLAESLIRGLAGGCLTCTRVPAQWFHLVWHPCALQALCRLAALIPAGVLGLKCLLLQHPCSVRAIVLLCHVTTFKPCQFLHLRTSTRPFTIYRS